METVYPYALGISFHFHPMSKFHLSILLAAGILSIIPSAISGDLETFTNKMGGIDMAHFCLYAIMNSNALERAFETTLEAPSDSISYC